MKLRQADKPNTCDVIEAEFVSGPVRCLKWADKLTTDDVGDDWYVCDEHAAGVDQ